MPHRCPLAFALLTTSAAFALSLPSAARPLQEEPPIELSRTFERLDDVDWDEWAQLADLLQDVHRNAGVPGLAAAVVRDGRVVDQAVVGVEAFGSDRALAPGARFHLGSVTKSMTATLIARLVERGLLRWDTRIEEVLTDVELHPAYRGVTLELLLQHRGGLHAFTDGPPPPEVTRALEGVPAAPPEPRGTPREMRAAFLAWALRLPPAVAPGTVGHYSNVGYALAGHMAERVAGTSWEALMQEELFEPLKLTNSGFGIPPRPLGHVVSGSGFEPVPLDAYPAIEPIAPAGNVHASVGDMARYALAHLGGLAGSPTPEYLTSATFARLHAPSPDAAMRYGGGWFQAKTPQGDAVHRHGGTVGASYARVSLYPERDAAVVVLTTVGPGLGEALAGLLERALLERFAPRSASPRMEGFVSIGAGAELEVTEEAPPEGDDERFWRQVDAIAEALNSEDRAAYHALFGEGQRKADRDSMFDFMARNVLPSRGGIHAFHAAGPLLRLGEERPLRMAVFHLENGMPGTIGIARDDAGKIGQLSLFVRAGICAHGTDRRCPDVVRKVGDEL